MPQKKDIYQTGPMLALKKLMWNTIGKNNTRYLHSFFPSSQEKEMMKRRHDFYMQFLDKGDTYFDVGANYGNRIEPIMNEGVNIVAVEPQEECVDFLKKRFGKKIKIVPFGLSSKEEDRTMFIAEENTKSSFADDWIQATKDSGRFSDCNWDETRTIKMTTMDRLVKEYGKPRFVKIDVEGFELEVLKGLSTPIEMISVEYTVPEQTNRLLECMQRIEEINGGNVLCNYSLGESMSWARDEWMPITEMYKFVQSEDFLKDRFGDMYLKSI